MLQLTHVLLLILGLLACPMRCAGFLAEQCAEGSPQRGCLCCGPVDALQAQCPEGDDSRPAEPGDDCSCGGCLCEGAVLTDDDALPPGSEGADTALLGGIAASVGGGAHAPDLSAPIVGEAERSRHRCGRDVRICHQSLLL